MTDEARRQLRTALRRQRRALDIAQQEHASEALRRRLLLWDRFREGCHIAAFIAADGEPDLMPLLTDPSLQSKHWYLPAIDPDSPERLVFRHYQPGDPLIRTSLGFLEPRPGAGEIVATDLDLVLSPLVGFDTGGNRMGMGKGFYDQTFAFKRETPDRDPWLVGIAHECQRVERLDTAWWDVPLNAVMTPDACYQAGCPE